MAIYTHHLPAWKREEVESIVENAGKHELIGLVDVYGIPARQFQQIRRNLHGSAVVKVARNTLVEHAFNELGGHFLDLNGHVSEHSALIFADGNPFKLFKSLEQTKTKRSAKAGEVAPEDIVVPAGPTSFKPGPIVANPALPPLSILSLVVKAKPVRSSLTVFFAPPIARRDTALRRFAFEACVVLTRLSVLYSNGRFSASNAVTVFGSAFRILFCIEEDSDNLEIPPGVSELNNDDEASLNPSIGVVTAASKSRAPCPYFALSAYSPWSFAVSSRI